MPASYQATVMRSNGDPILDLKPPANLSMDAQRRLLDTLREYNEEHLTAASSTTPISGCPHRQLRTRLQDAAACPRSGRRHPGDSKRRRSCTGSTTRRPLTSDGSACSPDDSSNVACGSFRSTPAAITTTRIGTPIRTWKSNHNHPCRRDRQADRRTADRPQTARPAEHKTLVVWSGEFGRQPTAEYAKGTGRDHNAYGFTSWMAGGGVKGRHERRHDRRTRFSRRRRSSCTSSISMRRLSIRWGSIRTV